MRLPGLTLLLLSAFADAAQLPTSELPPAPGPTASDRILVVAPHPDDETLCCAGYIRRALAAGATVAIVWITAGDGFEFDALLTEHHLRLKGRGMQRLGEMRIEEAFAAARLLGVADSRRWMLGYPDRGVTELMGANLDVPYRSAYTRSNTNPYAQALSPGATLTGRNLTRDLQQVIDEFVPTRVLAPAVEDRHPDHSTTGRLVQQVLALRGVRTQLRQYVIHAQPWPRPRGLHPELELSPPPTAALLRWTSFELTAAEREEKIGALRTHHTQMEAMPRYLESYVRSNELFAY